MSKFSEYQEQVRTKEAETDRHSVSQYAVELRKSTESLLKQLKEAGVPKVSGSEDLTSTDKATLLRHLEKQNWPKGRRKKITISYEGEEQKLIKRVAKQENGAEFEALRHLVGSVFLGYAIDPMFQTLVNLILVKAVLIGALPLEKLGRPKREELDSIGLDAAHRYWKMIDSGVGYEHAVEILSGEFHKSERHIMRLIAKHKQLVGDTPEIRAKNREWEEMVIKFRGMEPDMLSQLKALNEPGVSLPELNLDDYIEHLEELISKLADSVKPLTRSN